MSIDLVFFFLKRHSIGFLSVIIYGNDSNVLHAFVIALFSPQFLFTIPFFAFVTSAANILCSGQPLWTIDVLKNWKTTSQSELQWSIQQRRTVKIAPSHLHPLRISIFVLDFRTTWSTARNPRPFIWLVPNSINWLTLAFLDKNYIQITSLFPCYLNIPPISFPFEIHDDYSNILCINFTEYTDVYT